MSAVWWNNIENNYLFGGFGVKGLSDDKGTVDTKCARASAETLYFWWHWLLELHNEREEKEREIKHGLHYKWYVFHIQSGTLSNLNMPQLKVFLQRKRRDYLIWITLLTPCGLIIRRWNSLIFVVQRPSTLWKWDSQIRLQSKDKHVKTVLSDIWLRVWVSVGMRLVEQVLVFALWEIEQTKERNDQQR